MRRHRRVPRFARSPERLKETLKDAVMASGRAASEVAAVFGVSRWVVNTVVVAAVFWVVARVDCGPASAVYSRRRLAAGRLVTGCSLADCRFSALNQLADVSAQDRGIGGAV